MKLKLWEMKAAYALAETIKLPTLNDLPTQEVDTRSLHFQQYYVT